MTTCDFSQDKQTQILIQNLRFISKMIFGPDLVGVYLHGSMALGAYDRQVSDLDYLIIVAQTPTQAAKRQLMRETFLRLIPYQPQKGLEFHVMTQQEIKHGQHPFGFELHYSPMHEHAYRDDPDAYVTRMKGTDPDLAVHLAVTYQSGLVVIGQPIQAVFLPVSAADYLDSAWQDVCEAEAQVLTAPVYTILNLCRLQAFLVDGIIFSKADGGRWAIQHLDQKFRAVIAWALSGYLEPDHCGETPRPTVMISFVKAMLAQIALARHDQS